MQAATLYLYAVCEPVNGSRLSITAIAVRQAVIWQEGVRREEHYKCVILLRHNDRTAGGSCRNNGPAYSFIKHAFSFVSLWDASQLSGQGLHAVHELCLGAE